MQTIIKSILALSIGMTSPSILNIEKYKKSLLPNYEVSSLVPDTIISHQDYKMAMEYLHNTGTMKFNDLEYCINVDSPALYSDGKAYQKRILFEQPVKGKLTLEWGTDYHYPKYCVDNIGLFKYTEYSKNFYSKNIVKTIELEQPDSDNAKLFVSKEELEPGAYCIVLENNKHKIVNGCACTIQLDLTIEPSEESNYVETKDSEILYWNTDYQFENFVQGFDSTYKTMMGYFRPPEFSPLTLNKYSVALNVGETCKINVSGSSGDVFAHSYSSFYGEDNFEIVSIKKNGQNTFTIKGECYGHSTVVFKNGNHSVECDVYVDNKNQSLRKINRSNDGINPALGETLTSPFEDFLNFVKERITSMSTEYIAETMYFNKNHDIVTDYYLFKGERKLSDFYSFLLTNFYSVLSKIEDKNHKYCVDIERLDGDQLDELQIFLRDVNDSNAKRIKIDFDRTCCDAALFEAVFGQIISKKTNEVNKVELTLKELKDYTLDVLDNVYEAICSKKCLQVCSTLCFETDESHRDETGTFPSVYLVQRKRVNAIYEEELDYLFKSGFAGTYKVIKNQSDFENHSKVYVGEYIDTTNIRVSIDKNKLGFTQEYISYSTEKDMDFGGGLTGKVLRQRAGLISVGDKKYLTLSCKRAGRLPTAYIGFTFNKPISFVQFSAAIWGDDEDLAGNSLISSYALINGQWKQVMTYDSNKMAKKDTYSMYQLSFATSGSEMCYGFRYEITTIKTDYDRNRGRIVLDDIKVTYLNR